MARFDIISKDESVVRYSGKPRYIGSYLKPSFLEFLEISSPVPIPWEVGDYVDYPRTGMRYRLYSIPQPSKNARKDSYGGAFTYSNVQFYAATKELEIALFRDLVANDNGIHFSTSPDVATFENVEGIARRIQACMDDFYPGRWLIQIADFDAEADAEIIERISEAKDFALSGGTCLDALSKIYELWQDIGWIHSYEGGMEVITIGYANKRIEANTTEAYVYGKGNGLTAIRKSQTNKDEFATRLYVYGSDRNLPSRYYNGFDILNAESVDIRNLMLPLDKWGLTDGLPDARKAYLENTDAVAKYGIIPKTHYFDSADAGADIYPSIEGMTIGQIRKVLADMEITEYSPSTSIYPDDAERVDEVVRASLVEDDGRLNKDGKAHDFAQRYFKVDNDTDVVTIPKGTRSQFAIVDNLSILSGNISIDSPRGKVTIIPDFDCIVVDGGYKSVRAEISILQSDGQEKAKAQISGTLDASTRKWTIDLLAITADYSDKDYSLYDYDLRLSVYVEFASATSKSMESYVTLTMGQIDVFADAVLDKTFTITLKQIGFSIDQQASLGAGKTISMKTGMCAGRGFVIASSVYNSSTDKWTLTCKRQKDNTLSMLFPNKDYGISSGDRFVLTEIAMPETYIRIAMERLLAEGEKLLTRASRIQSHYEPSIDAKVMMESGRTLREGMFMEIIDEDVIDNTADYILIDTLSIYENESAIPTYKVTLRERRKVTYKGTPSATSESNTSSVDAGKVDTSDIDLSNYATIGYVNDIMKSWGDMFYFVDEDTIGTKYNLFSEKESSAGGVGEIVDGSGDGLNEDELKDYLTNNKYATQEWVTSQGYASDIDLNALEERVTAVESGGGTGSGNVDLTPYATKQWVQNQGYASTSAIPTKVSQLTNDAGYVTSDSLSVYAKKAEIPTAVSQLDNDAKYITGAALSPYALSENIPTKVSQLDNDAGYLASITAALVRDALGYTPFNSASFTKANIKSKLGISDWALAASKPSYRYSEITDTPDLSTYATAQQLTNSLEGKVDKETGKGLSSNDYTDADRQKLASLENYDDTEVKNGITANAEAIAEVSNRVIPLEEWYDLVGQHFKYDETNEAWYLEGDFYATGENSAGGAGDELIDIAGLDTRVETLETKVEELQKTSGQNLAIDFQGLDDLIQLSGSITPAELAAVGLTAAAIENMLNGQYNKIVHSGAKRQVWNYTAYEGDGVISIYLMQGDGFDIFSGYHLSYSSTTGYWSIVFGEI